MNQQHFFTSESVSRGHPDKIADQISDAILDACLRVDPNVRVACETLIKSDLVVIAGEISSEEDEELLEKVNVVEIARRVIRKIGYDDEKSVFNADSCQIQTKLNEQSANIAEGIRVNKGSQQSDDLGAGDQGFMFGYATDETEVLMPAPIHYAHRLMERQAELCGGVIPWLRPDAKSQVTFEYDDSGKPKCVDTIVLSTQHASTIEGLASDSDAAQKIIRCRVIEEIIKPVLNDWYRNDINILVNPAGDFVFGGPEADCGLTGRKIMVDTYGGRARHGGGAFSGKDPSKVDRSAAYAARHVAKSIVKWGMASECELQISYAIGETDPVSLCVRAKTDNGTSNADIFEYIKANFCLTPAGIIKALDLKRPIYQKTATFGHFGREDDDFSWEQVSPKGGVI